MDEEQLILLVQEYTFLYDLQDGRYSNQTVRENAWEEIAEKMKCSAKDCKKKWKNLRDPYRRSVENRKTKSGQAAVNHRKWKFEKEMEFLSKYSNNKAGNIKTNVPLQQDEDASVSDEDESASNPNESEDLLETQSE
ncbi:transcription factor Adf-1-like [Photinus pyralis]|uniref:transcription factor Adf-1-like n=1 Tax=Photinus pyralis TaxID=7054 RepID=UPI001267178A|nr:transcription factor Adf-1-like [Photinus pyralis]